MLNIAFTWLPFTQVSFSKVIYEQIEAGSLFLVAFLSQDIFLFLRKSNPTFTIEVYFQGFCRCLFLLCSINGKIKENHIRT